MRVRVAVGVVTVAVGLHAAILVGLGRLSKGKGPLLPAPMQVAPSTTPAPAMPAVTSAPNRILPTPVGNPAPATQPRKTIKHLRRIPPASSRKLPVFDLKFAAPTTEDDVNRP